VTSNKLALAWQKYLDSKLGKVGSDPVTLNALPSQRRFLENRLWHAFMAGAQSAIQLEREQQLADDLAKETTGGKEE
jgi:hypothetical protein